jgi:hypothetical protein
MKALAYWWLFFWLQVLAYVAAGFFGVFQITWNVDISKISFLIIFIHAFATALVGRQIMKVRRGESIDIDHGHFLANVCGKLGLLGTVVGFIFMISGSLTNLSDAELSTAGLRTLLGSLAVGIGTALWTTLWGLIAALLIEVQIHILERTEIDEEA